MFKKIKEWNDTRKTQNAMKGLIVNQFYDYLVAETEAKEAEKKAYESINIFSESFKPEDLQNVFSSIEKIASTPELTTEYYKTVAQNAQEQKMAEIKAVK